MALKTLSLRLEEELYDLIEKRAEAEGKTKTDLLKEMIQLALEAGKPQEFGVVLSKLEEMDAKFESLMKRTLVTSAATRFYGKQQTAFILDLGLHIQGKEPLSKKEKLDKIEERDEKATDYGLKVLKKNMDFKE